MFFLKTWSGLFLLLLLLFSCDDPTKQTTSVGTSNASSVATGGNPGVVTDLKADASVLSTGKWKLILTWTETANSTSYDIKNGSSSKKIY